MIMNDLQSPAKATTMEEMNIHLSYIRDKMNDNAASRLADMLAQVSKYFNVPR
jgi:hypothetical protein